MHPNFIVVLEGADNLGKTTVARNLCRLLNLQYIKFPNELFLTGDMIRKRLKGELFLDPSFFQLLNLVNQIQTMKTLSGNVLCDRYYISTKIYAQTEYVSLDWIDEVIHLLPEPDLTFIFTGRPFEEDDEHFQYQQKQTSKYYEQFLKENKDNKKVIAINANRPEGEVMYEIMNKIWSHENYY